MDIYLTSYLVFDLLLGCIYAYSDMDLLFDTAIETDIETNMRNYKDEKM